MPPGWAYRRGIARIVAVLAAAAAGAPVADRPHAAGTATGSAATSSGASPARLQTPRSLTDLLDQAGRERAPVVALFSREGCPWCEAIRRDQLVHLARDARAQGVVVVEFDIADRRPFATGGSIGGEPGNRQQGQPAPLWRIRTAESPAALASRLGIRAVPTVTFLGGDEELAERLVGYPSADFYGAYLEQRIGEARRSMQRSP